MSVCTFIASNSLLPSVSPSKEYPVYINIDTGVIDDGGADDNFFLLPLNDIDLYTNKEYGVYLEWNYTDARAENIINYLKEALKNDDAVELWHVWLMDYYEYEDRPIIYHSSITIDDLTTQDIKEFDNEKIWNNKDYPNRPSFYCLTITK